MKKRTPLRVISLVIASVMLLSACQKTPENTTITTVGSSKITLADFNSEYEYYLDYMQIEDGSEKAAELRQQIIDYMVAQKVTLEFAKEKGVYDLTNEQEAEVQASFDKLIEGWLEHYTEEITKEDETITGDALKTEAQTRLDAYIESIGYTKDRLLQEETDYYRSNKLYELITTDVVVTDDMAEIKYNDRIADAKAAYKEDPTTYQRAANGNTQTYYVPAGVRKVKHILIMLSDEQMEEVYNLRSKGDDEGADAKRAEYLATIDEKANKVLELLEPGGANFDEIAKEHNEDSGLEYQLLPGGKQMITEFTEAGLALENIGDISEPVGGDYGYHIMMYSADVPEGVVQTFDEAKESIIEEMLKTKKDAKYEEEFQAFKATIKIDINYKKLDIEATSK